MTDVSFGVAVSEEILGDGGSVPLQGGIDGAMRRSRALGFDSVEIHIREPRRIDGRSLQSLCDELDMTVAAIGTGLEYSLNGLTFTSDDSATRRQLRQRFFEHIDLAAPLSAVVFLGLCRGTAPDYASRAAYLNRLAQELIPIAEYAAGKGVILGFEPIVFYLTNLLNTTEETLEFLERPGLEGVQLLLDTHHMFIEDPDMASAFRQCAGRIAHVHISDSNRRYPLAGNVDFDEVARVLQEIGYSRAVSLEILPYPTGEEAARRGLQWMRRTWPRRSSTGA